MGAQNFNFAPRCLQSKGFCAQKFAFFQQLKNLARGGRNCLPCYDATGGKKPRIVERRLQLECSVELDQNADEREECHCPATHTVRRTISLAVLQGARNAM